MCRLNKSFYGLKQSPRAWYAKIDGFLPSISSARCKSDPNVYFKLIHGSLMIIFLYVDDLLITGSSDLKTRSWLLYDVNMNCIKSINKAQKSIRREPNSIDNTHIKTTN